MAEETPRATVVTAEADIKYVNLREFENRLHEMYTGLCQKIAYEVKLQYERDSARKEALDAQALEYARRLGELNHAHETAEENWRHSLPREIFEQYLKEELARRSEISLKLQSADRAVTQFESFEKRLQLAASAESLNLVVKELSLLRQAQDKFQGGLTVLRFMGFAGVIALALGVMRLAGVIPH